MKKLIILILVLVAVAAGWYFLAPNKPVEEVASQPQANQVTAQPVEQPESEPKPEPEPQTNPDVTKAAPVVETGYPGLTVENSWVRAAPPGASATAAYMTFRNTADLPALIVAVESKQFEAASLHTTVTNGDVVSMQPVSMIQVESGQSASLEPNGLHVMLMDAINDFSEGDSIEITFLLRTGERFTLNVPVQKQP